MMQKISKALANKNLRLAKRSIGFKKSKQVMAVLLSTALGMTSLPQGSTYVYAAEPMEESQTQELTEVQTTSGTAETSYSNIEDETAEGSEAAGTQHTEDKSDQQEKEEIYEEKTETQKAACEETETEIEIKTTAQEESDAIETEESTESEHTETEQETVYAEETAPHEQIVTVELAGAYQYGDAPSERDHVSAFSENLAADRDTVGLEQYLYQQMKERSNTINLETYGISKDKIGNIVSGVLNENPDLYYVKKGFRYSLSGNDVIEVMLKYEDSYDDNAFQKAVREALAVVKPEMSELEKAIVLHDYLVVNCEYDKENLDKGEIPDASYTAYGTLVNRMSVCEGYALTYKYLLNQSGINCLMVKSDAMNHAWNLIRLDGKYYQVDVTWDDPTWDKIGRARHEYMFRSDDAFVNACKHHDWTVTEGSEVVEYKAVDTSYDNAFWLDSDAPLVLVGEDCYYVTYQDTGVINKTRLSDTTGSGTTVCELGRWTVWQGNGFWPSAFSGLFYVNDRLYYNDQSSIRSFALDDAGNAIDKREEFKADTTNGYIYGSAFCQGKVLYSLHQDPNISAKETVLTADITIEIEHPSEIPVEKIELDKETLTLTAGATAVLKAVVTPNDATDAEITWESSDSAIAAVSNGTVTAVAAGSCTITASAGGKRAVCEVTVTDDEEDVAAGGSYEHITWKIDQNGKLTVTGTGNFSGADGFSRAPWYNSRALITSAEINVSDMTDASAMFYQCENLASVDVSGLDTKAVTDMSQMFGGCSSLTNLDLSTIDANKVTNISDLFSGCTNLTTIYTPINLTIAAKLPESEGVVWYQPDGTVITELPRNLSYSIQITKNSAPTVTDPYIRIQKTKTVYECGDSLNTDDLTVMYYASDGTAKAVTDYTTNANEIDMSVAGTKTLTVSYQGLTASLELAVTAPAVTDPDKENYKVTFDLQGHGTALEEYFTYTAIKKGTLIKQHTEP
ncbi:MAG: BspA family leucine-rich repeat surface protein [Lachnospiraceae bacterium]|nr:BspA family leucine-rich repeat surface protein [Lachnospiraceae bacterium]